MWSKLTHRKYFILRISYQWHKIYKLAWFNLLHLSSQALCWIRSADVTSISAALSHSCGKRWYNAECEKTQRAHTVSIVSLHAVSVRMRRRSFWSSLGELELCRTHRNVYARENGDWSYFSCIWALERVQLSLRYICNAETFFTWYIENKERI